MSTANAADVRYTPGTFFQASYQSAGSSHRVRSIDRANHHLDYVRMLECRHLASVQSELVRFCDLVLAGAREELLKAIGNVHDQRIHMLPALLDAVSR